MTPKQLLLWLFVAALVVMLKSFRDRWVASDWRHQLTNQVIGWTVLGLLGIIGTVVWAAMFRAPSPQGPPPQLMAESAAIVLARNAETNEVAGYNIDVALKNVGPHIIPSLRGKALVTLKSLNQPPAIRPLDSVNQIGPGGTIHFTTPVTISANASPAFFFFRISYQVDGQPVDQEWTFRFDGSDGRGMFVAGLASATSEEREALGRYMIEHGQVMSRDTVPEFLADNEWPWLWSMTPPMVTGVGFLVLVVLVVSWVRIRRERRAATTALQNRLHPEAALLEDVQKGENAWGELAAGIKAIERLSSEVKQTSSRLQGDVLVARTTDEKVAVVNREIVTVVAIVAQAEQLAPAYRTAAENLIRGHLLVLMSTPVRTAEDEGALRERQRVLRDSEKLFAATKEWSESALADLRKWHGQTRQLNEAVMRGVAAWEQLRDTGGLLAVFAGNTVAEIDGKLRTWQTTKGRR